MQKSIAFATAVGNDNLVSARHSFQPGFDLNPPHVITCLPMRVCDGGIVVSDRSFRHRDDAVADITFCNFAFDLIVAKDGLR